MAFKKRTIIKISLTVLAFLVLLLVFGYYNLSAKYDLLVDQSNIESKLLQNQFDEILKKYDSLNLVIEKNEVAEVEKVVVAAQENKKYFLSTSWNINHENKSLENKINLLKSKINEDSNEIIKINTILTQNKKELAELVSHKKNEYNLYIKRRFTFHYFLFHRNQFCQILDDVCVLLTTLNKWLELRIMLKLERKWFRLQ